MELQEIHSIAEIVAAFAVVGSLLFVGMQLRQGNVATLASNGQAAVNNWIQLRLLLATDAGLSDTLFKTLHPDLTEILDLEGDQIRLMYYMTAGMKAIESNFLEWQAGNLTDEIWAGFRAAIFDMFTYHTCWSDYWEQNQQLHSGSFRDLINGSIKTAELNRKEMIKSFSGVEGRAN